MKRVPFLPSPRLLLAAGIAAYAAGFAALSALRHDAYVTGRFDLGNMVQAVWSTAHGHPLRMTDLHGDQISRLAQGTCFRLGTAGAGAGEADLEHEQLVEREAAPALLPFLHRARPVERDERVGT